MIPTPVTSGPVAAPATGDGPATSDGPPGSWRAAWVAALDELSLALDDAEALLVRGEPPVLGPWTPPVLTHPLPGELAERARAVLARQLEVSDALVRSMAGNRAQEKFLDRLEGGAERERPVFLDRAF